MKQNELLKQIENQINPIIIGLNYKIECLIAVLNEKQLEQYKSELNQKREFIKMKLSSILTKEQLDSILEHLD